MAYNVERTERVRELLAATPNVTERKMFGSIGFMVGGKLCMGVGDHADHVMMVRVGTKMYAKVLDEPGVAPAVMRGREQKGYVFLGEDSLRTDKQLRRWVELALAYNKELTT